MAIGKKKGVHPTGRPTKAATATKKGAKTDAYGFGNKFASPNKKLEGPVRAKPKGVKVDTKNGRPDRPLTGPVGMVFPIPSKAKSPRKGKAK